MKPPPRAGRRSTAQMRGWASFQIFFYGCTSARHRRGAKTNGGTCRESRWRAAAPTGRDGTGQGENRSSAEACESAQASSHAIGMEQADYQISQAGGPTLPRNWGTCGMLTDGHVSPEGRVTGGVRASKRGRAS